MFGERGPVIPSLLQNQEASGVKIIISLIKIITGFNKVREKVKIFREVVFFFIWNFEILSEIMINFPWSVNTLIKKEEGRRRRKERRKRKREKERRRERKKKRGRF